jgi:hypothetical protein
MTLFLGDNVLKMICFDNGCVCSCWKSAAFGADAVEIVQMAAAVNLQANKIAGIIKQIFLQLDFILLCNLSEMLV